jgi:potassium voltage-gated channel Eag-related subfamily H protein 7
MTMTTVGYGDITAKNDIEKMINVLMMILACASFGYIINKLSTLLDELDNKEL